MKDNENDRMNAPSENARAHPRMSTAAGQLDALMTLTFDHAYSAEWIGQRFREWAVTPEAEAFMSVEVGETPQP